MKKLKCPEGGTTYKIPGGDPIFSDPEFKGLMKPLTPIEFAALEENLISDGRAIKPIIVWQEARIILDGHNRLAICGARNIPYKLVFIKFPLTTEGRASAIQWVIDHQLGQRSPSAEDKAELLNLRRDRVADMRRDGESIRTIAEKEGVSPTTIQRDLETATVQGVTVKPVGGVVHSKDGKDRPAQAPLSPDRQYCSRECRIGQNDTRKCKACKALNKAERQPGDDTESEAEAKREARSDPKQGKPDFDWHKFNNEFAQMMLWVDKLGKAFPGKHHKGPAATNLRTDLLAWKNRFKEWGKAISKKEPIPDVVDKMRRGRPKKGS